MPSRHLRSSPRESSAAPHPRLQTPTAQPAATPPKGAEQFGKAQTLIYEAAP